MTEGPRTEDLSEEFVAGLIAGAGLSMPPGAVGKMVAHASEMLRWNRSIRLTAITDGKEVAVKHILDSLYLLRFAPFPGRILDFGSGAGYPGIPLAVALPGSRVVLLESSGKKCAFLSHVSSRLSLTNTEIVRGRVEKRSPLGIGKFEHIVTRATLPEAAAVPLLLPYLTEGGRLLVMKAPVRTGGRPTRAEPGRTERFELPFGMGAREICEIAAR